ncbi:triose-phosphate isomerase [Aurantibacillus circumpalustris]|uniref:triose-phosphate isomerase n=1 Tax=Aurantibacillus circumpalustris TaxID=3036359 RepID=UPI00295C025B|nr:triose-phosphate isomerase [Aurantibacillus circumpalustris]
MKRKKIVAGNWKMNLSWVEAFDLATSIKEKSEGVAGIQKIIFPPLPYLQMLSVIVEDEADFFVGAQNCSEHEKGAYTGEVSAEMIESAGASFVLVGHSERRMYFSETNEQLIQKINQALKSDLKIIFCFGEHLNERNNNLHFETVKQQLVEVLKHYPKEKTNELLIAYEPVWAIGTGETATPAQAQEMHAFVRKTLSEIFSNEIAQTISILYGGSCNAQNAKELFSCEDVDGGLIGGASLKAEDFCIIMNSF